MILTHVKRAWAVGCAATWAIIHSPGFAHALMGAAITLVLGAFFALFYLGPWGTAAVCAFLMYVMRERRQSEEHFGSNRISLARWKPRAYRDFLWPGVGGGLIAVAIELAF